MPEILRTTRMNLAGLLHVLGDALYSTPEVVVRELVQNAHDSCVRRRIEFESDDERISIRCEVDPAVLIIEDNGAGLTADEIEEYLATVGSGYTRQLRDASASASGERNVRAPLPSDELIGYFGLGFLSAYVVATRVSVWTCSYREPERAWLFQSRGGHQYSIREAPKRAIGTEVRLELRYEHAFLADSARLREILSRYCILIDIPLFSNGERINGRPPPWRDPDLPAHPVARRRACLEFASRFETTFRPLTTHLIPTSEDLSSDPVQGVLWIQDGGSYASSDQRNVSLFVRGMWIGADERELLPRWAGFMGAALESRVLKPTASRESLKKDRHFEAAKQQIGRAVIECLLELASSELEVWEAVRLRHNEALLAACLCEPALFRALCDLLVVPTSEGEFTLPALLRRTNQAIYLAPSTRRGAHELLFRALRMPIVDGSRFAVAPFCRAYAEHHRARLVELDTEQGEEVLFRASGLDAESERRLEGCFDAGTYQVRVRRFQPEFLPFVAVEDEAQRLKEQIEADDANLRVASATLSLARLYTESVPTRASVKLYVNAASPIVALLLRLHVDQRARLLALLGPWILSQSGRGGDAAAFETTFREAARALEQLFGASESPAPSV